MNLQEFAALKPGDQISNPMGNSRGEVASTDTTGVRIRWLAAGMVAEDAPPQAPTWHYSVNSTAWMHWSKVEDTADAERAAEARNEAMP